VKVVEVRGNRVKLGFEYPAGNTVYREELFRKIQEENRNALEITPENLTNVLNKIGKKETP
jgi:carbon storage regulator